MKTVQQNLPDSALDLIICDIMMPIMSIPVIFLTARVTAADRRRGLALGADDYIVKPFGLAALLRSINTQLAKKEALLKCITATTKHRKL